MKLKNFETVHTVTVSKILKCSFIEMSNIAQGN